MATARTSDATAVASDVLNRLETAWNNADGHAFGAVYTPDASFVTIRGEHVMGADAIGRGHHGIFTSIYTGSVNRMRLVRATELADDVVLAISENTLQCPTGPLTGVHRAMSTNVLTRGADGTWYVTASNNTLERN